MNNTTAQIKQAIKKSALQVASEPLELLKNASRQISGEEVAPQQQEVSKPETEISQDEVDYKKQTSEQDGRHLQALESELKDIRRQKLFNDLMKRIQDGEDVSVEEFSELSFEQRDVLKAQLEAVKKQKIIQQSDPSGLIEPIAKKGRRMMGGGQKQSAQKQTTRVEKPVPPSG
ncbi:MAG: hypothetical protein QY322_04800 [bacterium]|nr:MAG: hypothetical protein QY322_04800 [bacterium]